MIKAVQYRVQRYLHAHILGKMTDDAARRSQMERPEIEGGRLHPPLPNKGFENVLGVIYRTTSWLLL